MATKTEIGKRGEEIAAGFLEAKGYHVMDRNYRFKRAEVDLVVLRLDPAELVFVEVKSRDDATAWPEQAVDEKKQERMARVADAYLHEKQMRTVPVRFDIIAIQRVSSPDPLIHHIEDAFRPFTPF